MKLITPVIATVVYLLVVVAAGIILAIGTWPN